MAFIPMRKLRLGFIITSCLASLIIIVHLFSNYYDTTSFQSLSLRDKGIINGTFKGCVLPELTEELNNGKRIKYGSKVKCREEEDWLWSRNGSLIFNDKALEKYSRISCDVTYIQRKDDFHSMKGKTVVMNSEQQLSLRLEGDFVGVECHSKNEPRVVWSDIMAGIHRQEEVLKRSVTKTAGTPKKLNALIFAFDSVSRLSFIRNLPELYKYLTDDLEAIVLQNFNVVGDGTTAALLGLLVGQLEEELPDTLKSHPKATTCDDWPFIWKNFSDNGYVTAYGEDGASTGTFQYRLKGFRVQPTDHNMRTFQMEAEKLKNPTYCLGSTTKLKVLMNWVQQVYEVYPKEVPKFVFGFNSEYSHDDNEPVRYADQPTKEWISNLSKSGHLDSTLMIVMADHGSRFSGKRETLQGKYEERLPFFSIVVPKWFPQKFPEAYRNLKINAKDRLISPFDVHSTFASVLSDVNNGKDISGKHDLNENRRGLNLFKEIPIERTCEDADISSHWCSCLQWQEMASDEKELVRRTGEAVVGAINGLLEGHDNCHKLELDEVKRAQKQYPKKDFLAFSRQQANKKVGSANLLGFSLNPSAAGSVTDMFIDVQILTKPSGAVFEATVKYLIKKDVFEVNTREISRVNKYGNQPHCIVSTFPFLSKYCYCK